MSRVVARFEGSPRTGRSSQKRAVTVWNPSSECQSVSSASRPMRLIVISGPAAAWSSSASKSGTVELLHRPVVLLHRPLPEVEVEVADRVLDRAPQRPAVLRHHAEESSPGHLIGQGLAVVMGDELLELVERQVGLAPDVAQLEGGIAVARVLPVDQPQPVAGVDDVGRQEVVVAGHDGWGGRPARPPSAGSAPELDETLGQAEAPLLDEGQVSLMDPEHVEVVGEPRARHGAPGRRRPGGGGCRGSRTSAGSYVRPSTQATTSTPRPGR